MLLTNISDNRGLSSAAAGTKVMYGSGSSPASIAASKGLRVSGDPLALRGFLVAPSLKGRLSDDEND